MGRWKLTIRHGSQVEHERLDSVEEAVAELRRRMERLAAAPERKTVKVLSRTFDPVSQVAARGELAGPGGVRAGIDVRGDGSTEAFVGRWRRSLLEPKRGESAYDALRRELAGD
jgi:hypothetical protein